VLPWNEEGFGKQTYPLRLPEPLHLKLKFLSEETGKSMNELCKDAVRDLVEERLRDVLEERD
jgi:predicted DNA-binding protein